MPGYLYRRINRSSAPWQAGLLTMTPRDLGVVVQKGSRAIGSHLYRRLTQVSTHAFTVPPPHDGGLVPVSDYAPYRTLPPRLRKQIYGTTIVASPLDAGQVGFVGVRGQRVPGAYLFRKLPQISSYSFMTVPPLDVGLDEIFVAELYPDRARGPQRAGGAAYQAGLFNTPHAADTPGVPTYLPPRAQPPRLPLANYAQFVASPRDLGPLQPIVEAITPDRAPAAQRTAQLAYSITIPALPDVGVLPTLAAVAPSTPDLARPAARAAAVAYAPLVATMPGDAGLNQPVIEPNIPAHAPATRRTSGSAYSVIIPPLPDPGTLPLTVFAPVAAWGPVLAGKAAYQLILASPLAADTTLAPSQIPDRSQSPRLPLANYAISTLTPQDTGAEPVPVQWPDRSAGPRTASFSAYAASVTTTPLDAGAMSVPPRTPERAVSTPLPLANYAFVIMPPLPVATKFPPFSTPITSTFVAKADAFDSTDPFGAKLLPVSGFAAADPEKAKDK